MPTPAENTDLDLAALEAVIRTSNAGTRVGFLGATPVARPAAPTAADASVVDVTYGAEEAGVINNTRTRVNQIEAALRSLGLLT